MSPVNLERLVPGLGEVRAQERQNRALAFAGLTHTVCGREILPLTPGHRLQLQLLRNAFFTIGESPELKDVFVFLWVLSPHNTGGIEGNRQQYFLREDVKGFELRSSVIQISTYLRDQLQDTAEGRSEDHKDQSPWIHWMAMDAEFWLSVHGGFTMAEYMRTPFLILQQLYRAWQCNNPDIERTRDGTVFVREPAFLNASDRLVFAFHRKHREAIKAHILSQKERRN